ncbi:hypothetical protein AR276_23105 [Stenotrophomonas maltophilia]|nr:hypothetical protein AR276_23105 [Stenotrophomonas maltophilia]
MKIKLNKFILQETVNFRREHVMGIRGWWWSLPGIHLPPPAAASRLLDAQQALFTLIACPTNFSTQLVDSRAARSASDNEVAQRNKREVHLMAWDVQPFVPGLERKEHM